MSQRVRYLAKRVGVKITTKTMRRGFGCRYAGKVSAHVLQKLMRHAQISTTMNVYGNALMEAKREANAAVVKKILRSA